MDTQPPLTYCLYARKSSESDERQAMSIESQVKEMQAVAIREGIEIVEIKRESHSAKISGTRPAFVELLNDIKSEKFNAILTWAPDRLSRNAGDLGSLVDLMDQKKLIKIQTFSQSFSNSPNEKFLLMILCSQAKLENDQKGLNVKRGIRAKCEMGWRPGSPPIGYYNRTMAGLKDIIVDPERGHVIQEMFERAKNGQSGRTIRKWFDEIGFTSRTGMKISLSIIYMMLKNPFYYGEFEYPIGSGKLYHGAHTPLVTKDVFNEVQQKLIVPKKSKWGGKQFDFKNLFKCACCGASIVGEDKYRKRKNGAPPRYHIYYHCSRQVNYDCPEPYVSQDELVKSILQYIKFTEMTYPQTLKSPERLRNAMKRYKEIRDKILLEQDVSPSAQITLTEYARHAIKDGTLQEKRDIVLALNRQLYIHNRVVTPSLLNG